VNTIKETPMNTIKETPMNTIKETPMNTIKETLKEISNEITPDLTPSTKPFETPIPTRNIQTPDSSKITQTSTIQFQDLKKISIILGFLLFIMILCFIYIKRGRREESSISMIPFQQNLI